MTGGDGTRSTAAALTRHVIAVEAGIWRSLYRWLSGRAPALGSGAVTFGYSRTVTPLFWAFIGVSAVEIPVLHLILPWRTVQIIVLTLGVWGLIWMIGMLASLKVHPHVVSEAGIRIRYSTTIDVPIDWDSIELIRYRQRQLDSSKTVQLSEAESGIAVHIAMSSQTNIEVTLAEPMTVSLPKGEKTVNELHFYADEPRAFLAAARTYF